MTKGSIKFTTINGVYILRHVITVVIHLWVFFCFLFGFEAIIYIKGRINLSVTRDLELIICLLLDSPMNLNNYLYCFYIAFLIQSSHCTV
jgi:hypothetical protein